MRDDWRKAKIQKQPKSPPYSPEIKYKRENIFKHQLDLPKKPKSPFLYFFEEHRKILKTNHPGWTALKVNRQVKIDWNKLDKKLKDEYKKLADYERKEYEEKVREKKGIRPKKILYTQDDNPLNHI